MSKESVLLWLGFYINMVFFPILKTLFFPIYSLYENLIQIAFPFIQNSLCNGMSLPMFKAYTETLIPYDKCKNETTLV